MRSKRFEFSGRDAELRQSRCSAASSNELVFQEINLAMYSVYSVIYNHHKAGLLDRISAPLFGGVYSGKLCDERASPKRF